jgi:hypothetical protein
MDNRTPDAIKIRVRIDIWNCIKSKSSRAVKETITRIKRQPTEWKKILASCSSDKGLITRIYKDFQNLNTKRINNPIFKMGK